MSRKGIMHYLKYFKEHGTAYHDMNTLHYITSARIIYASQPWQWKRHQTVPIYVMADVDIYILGCFWGKIQILHPQLIVKQKKWMSELTETMFCQSSKTTDRVVVARGIRPYAINCISDSSLQAPVLCSERSPDGASNTVS